MTVDFYDRLAPFFHLVYADWHASVQKQAFQIDSLIRELWQDRIHTILDATCGIGTQSIGLAQLGYQVTASDISPGAVKRAKKEADAKNVSVSFSVGDIRALSKQHTNFFDLVISCDNSIPHLLTDDEIRSAFEEMHRCASPRGGCLITVRDYDPSESGIKVVPFGLRVDEGKRYLVFQVWEYSGRIYDLSMYFIEDSGENCSAHVMRSKYYAIPVTRLMELMSEAGFCDVRRFNDRFFQPVITGSK